MDKKSGGGFKGRKVNRGSNDQKLPKKTNAGKVSGSIPPGSDGKSTR